MSKSRHAAIYAKVLKARDEVQSQIRELEKMKSHILNAWAEDEWHLLADAGIISREDLYYLLDKSWGA